MNVSLSSIKLLKDFVSIPTVDKYNIIEITMPSNIIKIEDIHLII